MDNTNYKIFCFQGFTPAESYEVEFIIDVFSVKSKIDAIGPSEANIISEYQETARRATCFADQIDVPQGTRVEQRCHCKDSNK